MAIKTNDDLASVINDAINTSLKELHTSLPGIIISFDPVTQLADIQPTIKRSINGELINLPVLSGVPIRFYHTNKFSIAIPLEKDDEVEIKFCERSLDMWLTYGDIQNPFDFRKHDLSDAYAQPTLYSQKNLIPDFPSDNLEIKSNNGTAKIEVTPDDDLILNSGVDFAVQFTALQTAFDELKLAFNTHTHVYAPGPLTPIPTAVAVPQSIADISLSKIDTIKVP